MRYLFRPPATDATGLLSLPAAVVASVAGFTVLALVGIRVAGRVAAPVVESAPAGGATTLATP